MTCDEVAELLIDYVEGELPRRPTHEIKLHLESCQACRQEAHSLEGVLSTLAQGQEDPGDIYFSGLYGRIADRIDNHEGLPWYRRFLAGFSTPKQWSLVAVPSALMLALIVVTVFPQLFTTAPIGPSGKPVFTLIKPFTIHSAALPASPTGDKVANLDEIEVEDLHNALMVALEDVMIEDSMLGDFGTTTVVPNDATALPSSLYRLDSEDLGDVVDKLSETSGNTI